MRRSIRVALTAFALVVALFAPATAGAVSLSPGDILVADQGAFGGTGGVISVDPVTGQQTAVSNNAINTGTDHFDDPAELALDAQGRILVADFDSQGDASGAVIRVDPATGQQTLVSTNAINAGTDLFAAPVGVALDAQGRILVTDSSSLDGTGAVIRVDPVTGQQTAVSNNAINTGTDHFDAPTGIALDPQGRILVADQESEGDGSGAVIRVDPVTGQQTTVSTNAINAGADLFLSPVSVALDPQDRILVGDPSSQGDMTGAVVRVDPASGQQTAISTNTINTGTDHFVDPIGVALDAQGRILVGDQQSQGDNSGAVIRVDTTTGQQTVVSSNIVSTADLFADPRGIAVVPPASASVRCRGVLATIAGEGGPNALTGTPGRDVIAALGGNDLVRGLGGSDVVCGGAGRDRELGGAGKDTLLGEAGKDILRGGPGRDRLIGGKGRDRLIGGGGRDILRGGPGRDRQRQ